MGTDLRARLRRLLFMTPTIAQCAVASMIAWIVAKDLLGHPRPFFAPIAVVICIGIGLGQRLRRLGELVVGVSVGVGVGDLLISQIGSGPWQIAVVVALAMSAAVFLDSGPVIALQAGSSAVLVATLLPPTGAGGVNRMIDTLVGGALGIIAVALLPANPAAIAHQHASVVLNALATALEGTAEAVDALDPDRAAEVLEEARGTQTAIENFRAALKTGQEIATISPLRRRQRRELARYETASVPVDHALRNTRVLARRTIAALSRAEATPPALSRSLRALAAATSLLRDELAAGHEPSEARTAILDVADHLGDDLGDESADRSGFSSDVMTAQLRSIIVDLLRATGADRETAIAALPQQT